MIGSIAGDIIGSRFEFRKSAKFKFKLFTDESRYTDDTVLTVALTDSILNDKNWPETIREYYHKYPDRGYGGGFKKWIKSNSSEGYGSYGNGSAMRVSPIGWACSTLSETLDLAEASAVATHNHEEGIKGAQAIAGCIYLARKGYSKNEIRRFARIFYRIPNNMKIARRINKYNIQDKKECSCQKTVPLAVRAFLSSRDFISSIRLAVMLGGDTDTIAAMTGGIAEAYYGVSNINIPLRNQIYKIVDKDLIDILYKFYNKLKKEIPHEIR